MQTIAVIVILAFTLFFMVRGIVRRLRSKGPSYGCCGCSGCPKTGEAQCHCKEKPLELPEIKINQSDNN